MNSPLCPSVVLRVLCVEKNTKSYTENHREDTENHRELIVSTSKKI